MGFWCNYTLDDYFPCVPFGEYCYGIPSDNQSYSMILEKALAKKYGNYQKLKQLEI